MIQPRLLERCTNRDRGSLHVNGDPVRADRRSASAWLKRCSLALLLRSFADRIEGFARDLLLETERRHRPARRIIRPPGNRKTDTRINRLKWVHPSNIEEKCHHQERQNCHQSIEAELSPMS